MRLAEIASVCIILVAVIISTYFYPLMPDMLPSHWNAAGEIDGYLPKFWGLFIMPVISVFMLLLFIAIPRIDPLKENVKKFRKHFDGFILLLMGFLLYLQLLVIAAGLGYAFSMTTMLLPALGVLFYYAGILIENAKRNWFIGIRTPWTLSSEKVWDRTHKRGGRLFKVAGILAIAGVLLQQWAFWIFLVPIIAFTAYLFVYSYFEYRKETGKKAGRKK